MQDLVGANERIQMIKLAAATSQWLHVSDWESRQEDWIPTREVLQYHQVGHDIYICILLFLYK